MAKQICKSNKLDTHGTQFIFTSFLALFTKIVSEDFKVLDF